MAVRQYALQLVALMAMASATHAQEATPPAPQQPPAAAAPPAAPATPAPKAAEPAPPAAGNQLPEVEVIQKKQAEPKATAQKKTVAKKAPAPAPAPAAAPEAAVPETPAFVNNIQMSPLPGSEIPRDKVPSAVSTIGSADIARDGTGQIQQVLQQQVPGIIISDAAGNSLRAEVSYRGFDASPVGGRAQGLAVYQNGVRINEAFGDTVNWDVIPASAIDSMTIVANNPVFGLNAIGGAVSIVMKDGFNYHGAEIDVLGGSFGRAQIAAQAGMQSGNAAAYVAIEGLTEEGFRDFSDSDIRRMYADIGLKGSRAEVHLTFTGADNSFGVTAAAPEQLLRESWSNTFTSPQRTDIEVLMPTLSASLKATDTLTVAGVAYYRHLDSKVIDGNLSDAEPCTIDPTVLCINDEPLTDINGTPIATASVDDPIGSIERINTAADSYGGSMQAVEKARVFGRPNQFLVGASYDHGRVKYKTSSELGTVGNQFVVTGSGIVVGGPEVGSSEDTAPRDILTKNDYVGVYFSNTMDITDAFALTLGGRYNHATIKMTDLTGNFDELNTTNKYERFNPMIGGTYKFAPALSLYGGYSEANRAPTAAELGCADPDNECFIESFLTDDPPLKQVVSHTYEAGFRGENKSYDGQSFMWSAGYFRTLNTDDILSVASGSVTGRGFFLNAGDTLREGIELAAKYQNSRWMVYGAYALVNATFEDDLILPAPNTPDGTEPCPDAPGENCNFVQSGDRMPGIPRHRFKAGFEYWLTPKWKFGSDLVAATDQIFFGDEANNNIPLPGYVRFDLHSSYDVTEHVQVYGLVKNLFDQKYGLYGTYFDTEEASEASTAGFEFTDARTITPAQPFAAYGGLKVKF